MDIQVLTINGSFGCDFNWYQQTFIAVSNINNSNYALHAANGESIPYIL